MKKGLKLYGVEVLLMSDDDFWCFVTNLFMEIENSFLYNGKRPTFKEFNESLKSRIEELFLNLNAQELKYVAYLSSQNRTELFRNSKDFISFIDSKCDLKYTYSELFEA